MYKIGQATKSIIAHTVSSAKATNKSNITTLSRRSLSTQYEQNPESDAKAGDRLTNILIRVIDAKPREPKTPPTKEELQKRHEIGRNYVIGNFKKHNAIHHDLACKIKLKNHAIDMLPKKNDVGSNNGYLRDKAMEDSVEEEFMPPYYRPIAVDTPPIPNYDPNDFITDDE
jgi:hypothetical protein